MLMLKIDLIKSNLISNMNIKELIMDNIDYQKNAENSNDEVAFLIFENRKLVLYELLGKVQHLKVNHKEHLERLKELK